MSTIIDNIDKKSTINTTKQKKLETIIFSLSGGRVDEYVHPLAVLAYKLV